MVFVMSLSLYYFNTSNVTIQLRMLTQPTLYPEISIHLMLLFNVKCLPIKSPLTNFNTSNVTIQHKQWQPY